MKLGSPPAAGVAEPSAASEAMPVAARNARRCGSDIVLSLCGPAKRSRGGPREPPKECPPDYRLAVGAPITSQNSRGRQTRPARALQAVTASIEWPLNQ